MQKKKKRGKKHLSPAERSWCSRLYQAATRALKLQTHINPCNNSSYLTLMNTVYRSLFPLPPHTHTHHQMCTLMWISKTCVSHVSKSSLFVKEKPSVCDQISVRGLKGFGSLFSLKCLCKHCLGDAFIHADNLSELHFNKMIFFFNICPI